MRETLPVSLASEEARGPDRSSWTDSGSWITAPPRTSITHSKKCFFIPAETTLLMPFIPGNLPPNYRILGETLAATKHRHWIVKRAKWLWNFRKVPLFHRYNEIRLHRQEQHLPGVNLPQIGAFSGEDIVPGLLPVLDLP